MAKIDGKLVSVTFKCFDIRTFEELATPPDYDEGSGKLAEYEETAERLSKIGMPVEPDVSYVDENGELQIIDYKLAPGVDTVQLRRYQREGVAALSGDFAFDLPTGAGKTVTGRTPAQPELQSIPPVKPGGIRTIAREVEAAFIKEFVRPFYREYACSIARTHTLNAIRKEEKSMIKKYLFGVMASRKPDFQIRHHGQAEPYLRRWYLIPRNRFFNIFLHEFLNDDLDHGHDLHDHPWWSLSKVLKGKYIENTEGGREEPILPNEWVLRKPTALHRISLFRLQGDKAMPAYTLFLTGPTVRTWGFQTAEGWVASKKYLERLDSESKRS